MIASAAAALRRAQEIKLFSYTWSCRCAGRRTAASTAAALWSARQASVQPAICVRTSGSRDCCHLTSWWAGSVV